VKQMFLLTLGVTAVGGDCRLTGNAGGGVGFEPRPGQTFITEILRGFLQSLLKNVGLTPQTRPQPYPPTSFPIPPPSLLLPQVCVLTH
jgi:hypothetical protein